MLFIRGKSGERSYWEFVDEVGVELAGVDSESFDVGSSILSGSSFDRGVQCQKSWPGGSLLGKF